MKNNSWLSSINLIILTALILICITLAFVLASTYAGVASGYAGFFAPVAILMEKLYSIGFTALGVIGAIFVIGFILVVAANFERPPKDNSGWFILVAAILFPCAILCLLALVVTTYILAGFS